MVLAAGSRLWTQERYSVLGHSGHTLGYIQYERVNIPGTWYFVQSSSMSMTVRRKVTRVIDIMGMKSLAFRT